jgi:hypothetical protein
MIIVKLKNNKTHVLFDIPDGQCLGMGNALEFINFVVLPKEHELPDKLR